MCGMYLDSYRLREAEILQEINKIRIGANGLSALSSSAAAGVIVVKDSVSNFLGGALRSLLDCRFALTPTVLDRHGQTMIDQKIVKNIAELLKMLTLKLLKVLNSVCYEDATAARNDTLGLLKNIYSELFKTKAWKCSPSGLENGPSPGIHSVQPSMEGNSDDFSDASRVYDMLDRLNSSEWLRINLILQ
jgi:hypothetical protein